MHLSRSSASSLSLLLSTYFIFSFCISSSKAWNPFSEKTFRWLAHVSKLQHGIPDHKYEGPPTFNGTDFGYPLTCNGPVPNVWLGNHYGSLYAFCAVDNTKHHSVGCSCKRRPNQADVMVCKGDEILDPATSVEKADLLLEAPNLSAYCGKKCSCPGSATGPEPEPADIPLPLPPNPDYLCYCNETYISESCCLNTTRNGIVHEPAGYNWYDYLMGI